MNKAELIEHLWRNFSPAPLQNIRSLRNPPPVVFTLGSVSKRDIGIIIDSMIGALKTTLKQGGKVNIRGLGTFYSIHVNGRAGRNPRTGTALKIRARTRVRVTPALPFTDAVN